jgi:hypothetical protein
MTLATTSPRAERHRLVTCSDLDGLVCAALLEHLIVDVCTAMSIEEILQTPDVKQRVELYFARTEVAEEQIRRPGRRNPYSARFDRR